MKESELSKSLKFALFLLGLFSVPPILVGVLFLLSSIVKMVSQETQIGPSVEIGIEDYTTYFSMVGVGFGLYLTGRIFNFIGSVIKEINLQVFSHDSLRNRLCQLGQEACFILIFIGSCPSMMKLIDNLAQERPFGYYEVIIVWLIIIILCRIASHFLKKQFISETETPD